MTTKQIIAKLHKEIKGLEIGIEYYKLERMEWKEKAQKLQTSIDAYEKTLAKQIRQISSLKETIRVQEEIIKHGKVCVNFYSRDCDLTSGYWSNSFQTVDAFNQAIASLYDSAEGPVSYEICSEEEMQESRTYLYEK